MISEFDFVPILELLLCLTNWSLGMKISKLCLSLRVLTYTASLSPIFLEESDPKEWK